MIDQNSNSIQFGITCNLPCKTCQSTNKAACLSCYNDANIAVNNTYYSVNNTCLTSCPTGYFDSGTLICAKCAATCLTCSKVLDNCTSCNTASTNPALNKTGFDGVCLAACPAKFYLSTAATPTQCVACDTVTYHCLTCSA